MSVWLEATTQLCTNLGELYELQISHLQALLFHKSPVAKGSQLALSHLDIPLHILQFDMNGASQSSHLKHIMRRASTVQSFL